MTFEAEVIPLFIGGVSVVSVLELVVGCMMLKGRKKARNRLIGHVASMAIAMVCLVRCIFAKWLDIELGIDSIDNSVYIGLFGVFWVVSVCFLLSMVKAGMEKGKER